MKKILKKKFFLKKKSKFFFEKKIFLQGFSTCRKKIWSPLLVIPLLVIPLYIAVNAAREARRAKNYIFLKKMYKISWENFLKKFFFEKNSRKKSKIFFSKKKWFVQGLVLAQNFFDPPY